MIVESSTGKDLSPRLLIGEMERRIGQFYDGINPIDKLNFISSELVFCKFENLPKFIKQDIINKLT